MDNLTDNFLLASRILQRRRQFLALSFLYYVLDETVVSDGQFNSWCRELIELQREHPQLCSELPYHDLTYNLDTGYSAEAMGLDKSSYPLSIITAALFVLREHKKSKKSIKKFAESYGYSVE